MGRFIVPQFGSVAAMRSSLAQRVSSKRNFGDLSNRRLAGIALRSSQGFA